MRNYLSNRLKDIFKDRRTSMFDYFKSRPEAAMSYLDRHVIIKDDTVTIKKSAWRFDYPKYLRDKGYRICAELGFNEGPIYSLRKVNV